MAIFRQGPPNGGVEFKEGVKTRDFRPISRYMSEMIQAIRPYLLRNANRKPYLSFRMVTLSMTLSDS